MSFGAQLLVLKFVSFRVWTFSVVLFVKNTSVQQRGSLYLEIGVGKLEGFAKDWSTIHVLQKLHVISILLWSPVVCMEDANLSSNGTTFTLKVNIVDGKYVLTIRCLSCQLKATMANSYFPKKLKAGFQGSTLYVYVL